MPEGDTIFRTATRLRPLMVHRHVVSAHHRDPKVDVQPLQNQPVTSIEARGKHLLMYVGDRVIHSHMGMTGSWHVYADDEPWKKPPSRAALSLRMSRVKETNAANQLSVIVCFSPKLLEIIDAERTPTASLVKSPGTRSPGWVFRHRHGNPAISPSWPVHDRRVDHGSNHSVRDRECLQIGSTLPLRAAPTSAHRQSWGCSIENDHEHGRRLDEAKSIRPSTNDSRFASRGSTLGLR